MLSTILFYLILTRSQYGRQYYSCFEISRDVDKLTWPIPKTLEAADVVFRIYRYLTPEILLITSSHCSSLYWFLISLFYRLFWDPQMLWLRINVGNDTWTLTRHLLKLCFVVFQSFSILDLRTLSMSCGFNYHLYVDR